MLACILSVYEFFFFCDFLIFILLFARANKLNFSKLDQFPQQTVQYCLNSLVRSWWNSLTLMKKMNPLSRRRNNAAAPKKTNRRSTKKYPLSERSSFVGQSNIDSWGFQEEEIKEITLTRGDTDCCNVVILTKLNKCCS